MMKLPRMISLFFVLQLVSLFLSAVTGAPSSLIHAAQKTVVALGAKSTASRRSNMANSIIIAGATGAIGQELVAAAVASGKFGRIVALSRRNIAPKDWPTVFPSMDPAKAADKLEVVQVDWEALTKNGLTYDPPLRASFDHHTVAANCMGTTRHDAGSSVKFRQVDLDFAKTFAKTVKAVSNPRHYMQVSSSGADPSSLFLYTKTKGEADEMALAEEFPSTAIFRPGLLGRGERARWMETVAAWVMKPIPVATVAKGMLSHALQVLREGLTGQFIFDNRQIIALAAKLNSQL